MAAADETRARLERDEARRDLDALTKLNSTGAASPSEVAAARQRLDAAEANFMPRSRAQATAIRRQRWSVRGRRLPMRKPT